MKSASQLRTRATLSALIAFTATAATAGTMPFSGTFTFINAPAPPTGRCAPARTITHDNVGNDVAKGTSNLGGFLAPGSACVVLPPPTSVYDGVFDLMFSGGGTIFGTWTSALTPSGTPGLIDEASAFTITGGTGRFGGANGSFNDVGTLDFRTGAAINLSTFTGSVTVPEPALAGVFALSLGGWVVARRRRPVG